MHGSQDQRIDIALDLWTKLSLHFKVNEYLTLMIDNMFDGPPADIRSFRTATSQMTREEWKAYTRLKRRLREEQDGTDKPETLDAVVLRKLDEDEAMVTLNAGSEKARQEQPDGIVVGDELDQSNNG